MNKCDCYCEDIKAEPRYNQYTGDYVGSVDVKFAYCIGTKEQDECSCGGDHAKCDFYHEIREKAVDVGVMYKINMSNDNTAQICLMPN